MNLNNFGINLVIKEIDNRDATKFVEENYDEIIQQTLKMGVQRDRAYDLVNDVYISLNRSEENGDCFDTNFYEGTITVADFVYGRIKAYSKNINYQNEVVQQFNMKKKADRSLIALNDESSELDIENLDYNRTSKAYVIASSFDGSDIENMNSFQRAYATAGSSDEIELVEEALDIREQIDYCVNFNDTRVGIVNLLKNAREILNSNIDSSLFDDIKDMAKYHDEFGQALMGVLRYSIRHEEEYERIIAAY